MKSFTTRPLVIAFLLTISSAASGQIYVGGSIGGSYAKAESSNSNFRLYTKCFDSCTTTLEIAVF